MNIPIDHVSSDDLRNAKRFKTVDLISPKKIKGHLHTSLCVPSYTQAYSACISYMKNWFLNLAPKDYFKSVYIEGKNAFVELKDKDINTLVKKPKPSLAIIPHFDYTFDNNTLNWQFGDKFTTTRITHGRDIFFSDKERNLYLAYTPFLISVIFTFKIRVNTKAKQLDLYNYLYLAIGDSTTTGVYVQIDYDVPEELMFQIAQDASFEVKDGLVVNNLEFLAYLNKHSNVPFLFKMRNVNGKRSYFIRPVAYIHIKRPEDMDLDDGERQGQVQSNFILSCDLQVRFPSILFFKYMSLTQHDNIRILDGDGNIKAIYANFSYIPQVNSQNWEIYMETDYEETDVTKPLKIEFAELFNDTDVGKIIDLNLKEKLSPNGFLDIHLFNDGRDVPLNIDWENKTMYTVGLVNAERSRIVVYMDKQSITDQLTTYNDYIKTRINEVPERFKQL